MPQAKPRWNKERRCWTANIGEPRPDGRSRSVRCPLPLGPHDHAQAWAWFEARLKARRLLAPSPVSGTVSALAEAFAARQRSRAEAGKITPEHARAIPVHLSFLVGHFGDRQADSLARDDLQRLLDDLATRYSPHYVRNIARTYSSLFNWIDRSKSPMIGVEKPGPPPKVVRYASRAEAAAWLRWLRSRCDANSPARRRHNRDFALLMRVLIGTGARPKELCEARWRHVEWESGRSRHGGPKAVIRLTNWKSSRKTGEERAIFLTASLTRALRRSFARRGSTDGPIFMHGHGRGGVGRDEPWKDGSALAAKSRKIYAQAIAELARRREAGEPLRGLDKLEHIQIWKNYIWRHTSISNCVMRGIDVSAVAAMHGTSVDMIRTTYEHLRQDYLHAAHDRASR